MPIKELLKLLYQVSKLRGTSPCLIVGGVVRDKLIGTLVSMILMLQLVIPLFLP